MRYKLHGIDIDDDARALTGRDYVRELVRLRDNRTCQKCGKVWQVGMRRFDVHHTMGMCGKNSRGYDKVAYIDKMVTYCHKCHLTMPHIKKRIRVSKGVEGVWQSQKEYQSWYYQNVTKPKRKLAQ
jgi:hypothetical protein